ncbi:uncharacterized protein LOC143205784 [Rhynchophorus ferrugineus]|uniref:uncharacterized protein LOC143205784 n=1 Tax=Rhynchophorus ferrugineus TaxID=354439 RepID=UPI003FCE71E0
MGPQQICRPLGESIQESNQFGEFATCIPIIQWFTTFTTPARRACRLPGSLQSACSFFEGPTTSISPTRRACRLPGSCNHRAGYSRALQPACRLPDGCTAGVNVNTRNPQQAAYQLGGHDERSFSIEGPQRAAYQLGGVHNEPGVHNERFSYREGPQRLVVAHKLVGGSLWISRVDVTPVVRPSGRRQAGCKALE